MNQGTYIENIFKEVNARKLIIGLPTVQYSAEKGWNVGAEEQGGGGGGGGGGGLQSHSSCCYGEETFIFK